MAQDSGGMGKGEMPRNRPHSGVSSGGRAFPGLPLAISERKALLGLFDLILVNASLWAVACVLPGIPGGLEFLRSYLIWFIALSLIWAISALAFDCYDLKRAANPYESLFAVGKALLTTTLLYLLVPYVLPSRRLLGLFFLIALALVGSWRLLYAMVLSQPSFRRRALVVGAGWAGRTIASAIHQNLDAGYELVGFIDDDPEKQGKVIEGLAVLGKREDLVALVKASGVDELILAITHNVHEDLLRALMACYEAGTKVSLMPILYETVTGRVPVEHIGPHWHVALPAGEAAIGRVDLLLKRTMDLLAGLVGVAILALLTPLIGLVLFLESPGPIFASSRRLGRGGRAFRLVGFRAASPREGTPTRVGRFLRATYLERLPYSLNILRGEMSLVGPRPEPPARVQELEEQIPFYRARQAVRPGLTGWAQVKYRYGGAVEDSLARLQYDLYYIKHQSLYLDLLIILQSVAALFRLPSSGRMG